MFLYYFFIIFSPVFLSYLKYSDLDVRQPDASSLVLSLLFSITVFLCSTFWKIFFNFIFNCFLQLFFSSNFFSIAGSFRIVSWSHIRYAILHLHHDVKDVLKYNYTLLQVISVSSRIFFSVCIDLPFFILKVFLNCVIVII